MQTYQTWLDTRWDMFCRLFRVLVRTWRRKRSLHKSKILYVHIYLHKCKMVFCNHRSGLGLDSLYMKRVLAGLAALAPHVVRAAACYRKKSEAGACSERRQLHLLCAWSVSYRPSIKRAAASTFVGSELPLAAVHYSLGRGKALPYLRWAVGRGAGVPR